MITVCLDGNYIFHKTFGIFSGFGSKTPEDVLSSKGDRNIFMRKIITDLCYALNQIPDINKIIFCKDSRSWRKDYIIERSVYKESREEKPEGVNWSSFYKLIEEFGEYLESMGFIYSKFGGAEGDDLLWAWSDYLKDSDANVIILSGDRDMHQLVYTSPNNWVNIWTSNSKNNRLIVDKDWEMKMRDEPSIFDVNPLSGESDNKMMHLVSSCTIDRIDVKEYIFKKILAGDKKDDVPGVFPYKTANGTVSNIAEGKAKKIWDLYIQSPWEKYQMQELWENDEFLEWISGLAMRLIKQNDNRENRELFKKHYHENAKLVWLNENTIPEDIVNGMREHITEMNNKERSRIVFDKKTMIENSPWADNSTAPSEFDPFNLF